MILLKAAGASVLAPPGRFSIVAGLQQSHCFLSETGFKTLHAFKFRSVFRDRGWGECGGILKPRKAAARQCLRPF
jgi:hypothetical protein